ncbi:MAG: choice-of-anchor Q domain-containing protein [Nannocystales bacterium]
MTRLGILFCGFALIVGCSDSDPPGAVGGETSAGSSGDTNASGPTDPGSGSEATSSGGGDVPSAESGSTAGDDGSTGDVGEDPPSCEDGPAPEVCGNGIDEDCDGEDWACPEAAVHVDNVSGDDGADGSAENPVASVARGLELAESGTVIFLQATELGYTGACITEPGISLVGWGGQPVIDQRVECDGRAALIFSRADDFRIENVRLDASALGGLRLRALIFSGLPDAPIYRNEARFVDALGPGVGPDGRSLISASLCYDCLLEYSSSIESEDHGIYWTNHQDGSVIRGNYVARADGACLQLNADPETNDPMHPFQDGIMSDGLVEDNVLEDCGNESGGAALNLAGVHDTVFRNNLMFGSPFNGGVAMWDDGYSDWGEAGDFDFGCVGNEFVHNTIDCRGCDRHAFSLRNGSTSNIVRNNIFITAEFDAVAVDSESNSGNDVDYNVYLEGTIFEGVDGQWVGIEAWRVSTGHDLNSLSVALGTLFVDEADGDYRLAPNSPAIDAGSGTSVPFDYDDVPRPQGTAPDPGAFEFVP